MCYCAGRSFRANTAGGSIPPVVSTKPMKLFLKTVLDEDEGQAVDLPASFLLPPGVPRPTGQPQRELARPVARPDREQGLSFPPPQPGLSKLSLLSLIKHSRSPDVICTL